MEESKQAKYCFNLPNNARMLCFNKLTGEHNPKKYFKNFRLVGNVGDGKNNNFVFFTEPPKEPCKLVYSVF